MKHLFVPYKLALLAKEKEFEEPCFAYYQQFNIPTPTFHFGIIQHHQNENYKGNNWNKIDKDFQLTDYINNNFVSAPLYQQLIDWFREKYDIVIEITRQKYFDTYANSYAYEAICKVYKNKELDGSVVIRNNKNNHIFYSYKEAHQCAILKSIQIIKEKGIES